MILIDTGPLVAAFNPREPRHAECAKTLLERGDQYMTTIACLTEALYFIGEKRGWGGQNKLLGLIEVDALSVAGMTSNEIKRARKLMDKYSDTPMDFADASLVVAAESYGENRIFTFDGDFKVYRIHGRRAFELTK